MGSISSEAVAALTDSLATSAEPHGSCSDMLVRADMMLLTMGGADVCMNSTNGSHAGQSASHVMEGRSCNSSAASTGEQEWLARVAIADAVLTGEDSRSDACSNESLVSATL